MKEAHVPQYVFKPKWEILWVAIVAAAIAVLQVLIDFDPQKVTDWKLWFIALGGAAVRSAAGALIAYITRPSEVVHPDAQVR